MQTPQPNLFTRDDTLFGVCQGLGEDLGFNPNLLRVPFAVLLLWNPVAVLAAYLGLGALVAVTRWISPDRKASAIEAAVEPEVEPLAIAA
jgi:phage shock protein PspC (stress-responsive transcriptional regulator)